MSTLLDDRYVLAPHDTREGSLLGRDRLLDRDVDVVLLAPVTNTAERAAFVRALRRSSGITAPTVCPVLDIGCDGDRPYLVVPHTTGRLDDLLRHPVPPAVQARVARDVVAGVVALEDRQLRPRSLQPSDVRLDTAGVVQLLPTVVIPSLRERVTGTVHAAAVRAAVREEVRQFFQRLLSAGAGSPPAAVLAFAQEAVGRPLRDLQPALDSWFDAEAGIHYRGAAATVARPAVSSGAAVSQPAVVSSGTPPTAPRSVTEQSRTDRSVTAWRMPGPTPTTSVGDSGEPATLEDSATRRIVARVTVGVGLVLVVTVTVLTLVTLLGPV